MPVVVSTVFKLRCRRLTESPNVICRLAVALSRHSREGWLRSGVRPIKERTVLGFRFDDGTRNVYHFGSECGHHLAAAIRVIALASCLAAKLVAEAVVALANGDLRGHPEGAA